MCQIPPAKPPVIDPVQKNPDQNDPVQKNPIQKVSPPPPPEKGLVEVLGQLIKMIEELIAKLTKTTPTPTWQKPVAAGTIVASLKSTPNVGSVTVAESKSGTTDLATAKAQAQKLSADNGGAPYAIVETTHHVNAGPQLPASWSESYFSVVKLNPALPTSRAGELTLDPFQGTLPVWPPPDSHRVIYLADANSIAKAPYYVETIAPPPPPVPVPVPQPEPHNH